MQRSNKMIIDTHKAVERLISAKDKKESAEVVVDIINSIDDRVATKSDIKEVKAEIGSLRSEISTMKWMLGIFGTSTIMMLSFILSKL